MSATAVLVSLLGAGALLLWGLSQVKTGIMDAMGGRLRLWLANATRNRFTAFAAGLGATLLLQSSTATALMTASFAGQGMFDLAMAQAIMLGANVGTSIVAQVLVLDVQWLAPVLLAAGYVVWRFRPGLSGRGTGSALVGLGLMLVALHMLSTAAEPLRESEPIVALLDSLGAAPLLAVLIAAVLAAASSSSMAVVLLVAAIAADGSLPASVSVALVAGANLGGAVPPVLATSRDDVAGRRVTVGNLCVRGIGAAVVVALDGIFADALVDGGLSPAMLPVTAHVLFNLAVAVVFLPLLRPVSRLTERLVPDRPPTAATPMFLDDRSLQTPALALAAAARETLRIGDFVYSMATATLASLESRDDKPAHSVHGLDDTVDELQQAVKLYCARLDKQPLDAEQSRRNAEIVNYAINLEHIGDILDNSLRPLVEKRIHQQLHFSAEGLQELATFFNQTMENLRLAQSVFMSRDPGLARTLVEVKEDVRAIERNSAERHFDRLRAGRPESLQTSSLHLDVLRDLKRINAHIASVAYPILDERGALRESRLRAVPAGGGQAETG